MKKKLHQKIFFDSNEVALNSEILDYLLFQYEEGLKESQEKALRTFWRHAEAINKSYQWMTDEEMKCLKSAASGDLSSILILVRANPGILRLPFVVNELIRLLNEYKHTNHSEIRAEIRQVVWPSFLKRQSPTAKPKHLKYWIGRLMETSIPEEIAFLESEKRTYKKINAWKDVDNLVELIEDIKKDRGGRERTGKVTKAMAIQIIRHYSQINERVLSKIRMRERRGRPPKF